jgi:hypothetical protein
MEILARRFGKKIKLSPTIQIKREILLRWLEDQTAIEVAEAKKDRFENQLGVDVKAATNCGVRQSTQCLSAIGGRLHVCT